uniref:Putative ovule protein n=1 Tax=Solanum chacoense TaxID=4108 RepID=A0A0V0HLA1_SOLCH
MLFIYFFLSSLSFLMHHLLMCREIVAHLMLNNYELILELSDILGLFDGFVKCVGIIWVVQKKKQN